MRLFLIVTVLTSFLRAHEGHHHNPAAAEMTKAATLFLRSLNEAQRKDASIPFQNTERENWHFVPMNDRKGVRFGELQPHQQHLAFGLLNTGLSQKGFLTATQIMTLEQILQDRGGDPELRDTEKYFIAIFGSPSPDKPWGWRFEGHHLSLNFAVIADQIHGLPAFFGTNPAELKKGPLRGMRPLGEVEDAARRLALQLVAKGKSPVFSQKPPKEILTGQEPIALALKADGIASADLSSEELKALLAVIDEVASLHRGEVTNDRLRKIHTVQRKKLHFGWGGLLRRGAAHYFRIQGPDFVIEYANTQNDANHAHLVWRDLKNDFARDALKKHYAHDHE